MTDAWSFVGLLVVVSILTPFMHRMRNVTIHIQIWEEGFRYENKFFEWERCKGFWILQGPTHAELHIEPLSKMREEIMILTGTVDPFELRETLLEFLPEFPEREEKLIDNIIRICKL